MSTVTLEPKKPQSDVLDVVARRRATQWEAHLLRSRRVRAHGATRDEAVENLLAETRAEGRDHDTTVKAARVLILGLFFLVAARLLEGTEYLRVPADLIDDETAAVLRDPDVLADLRSSEADVVAGRTTSLDELRRELGRG